MKAGVLGLLLLLEEQEFLTTQEAVSYRLFVDALFNVEVISLYSWFVDFFFFQSGVDIEFHQVCFYIDGDNPVTCFFSLFLWGITSVDFSGMAVVKPHLVMTETPVCVLLDLIR